MQIPSVESTAIFNVASPSTTANISPEPPAPCQGISRRHAILIQHTQITLVAHYHRRFENNKLETRGRDHGTLTPPTLLSK